MNDKQLYSEILGIANPLEVTNVNIDLNEGQVEIVDRYVQDRALCVEYNTIFPTYDQCETRCLRHLDTCQLKTYLAIELLFASNNKTKTGTIFRTSFDTINHIMHRSVERGLRRLHHTKTIKIVGIDKNNSALLFYSSSEYLTST